MIVYRFGNASGEDTSVNAASESRAGNHAIASNVRCKIGDVVHLYPRFGVEGGKRSHCKRCKTGDMVDLANLKRRSCYLRKGYMARTCQFLFSSVYNVQCSLYILQSCVVA